MKNRKDVYAIIILGILFFSFGFITWLNGTLIPFLKLACQLRSDVEAFFVTFSFYMAYFFLALPSSYILRKTGYKKGMALGLLIMAVGSLVFIPAARMRLFPLFLTGLFTQGMGLALLQTAVNPYISILGPIESAARRISIMGICNKTAGVLSPLIVSSILLKNATNLDILIQTSSNLVEKERLLHELSNKIILPYMIITLVLFVLSVLIYRSSLPEIKTQDEISLNGSEEEKHNVFQFPHLLLGVLCLFLYVGAEVMAGDAIGTYGKASGLPLDATKYFTTYTLVSMLVGYIIGIFMMPRYLSQQAALKYSALLGILLSIMVLLSSGYLSIVFIALLGLANALMWPAIFPLAIKNLGKYTETGSALLIMGIAGGAVIPLLYGVLKDRVHLSNPVSFLVCMLPCYVYILYYAIRGYRVK